MNVRAVLDRPDLPSGEEPSDGKVIPQNVPQYIGLDMTLLAEKVSTAPDARLRGHRWRRSVFERELRAPNARHVVGHQLHEHGGWYLKGRTATVATTK